MASCAARHQSSGSCSAQPGCDVRNGACSLEAPLISLPFSSTTTARVPPVPTSMPRNHIACTPHVNRFSLRWKHTSFRLRRKESPAQHIRPQTSFPRGEKSIDRRYRDNLRCAYLKKRLPFPWDSNRRKTISSCWANPIYPRRSPCQPYLSPGPAEESASKPHWP